MKIDVHSHHIDEIFFDALRSLPGVTVKVNPDRFSYLLKDGKTWLPFRPEMFDPDHLIRPDPALGENFVFGPVAAGTYDVYTSVQGVEYRQTVEVLDGSLSTVEIVTEPYRTPTPEPPATP